MGEAASIDRLGSHLLSLCRVCAEHGWTAAQINAAMPRLAAFAEVMVAHNDAATADVHLMQAWERVKACPTLSERVQ